MLASMRMEVNAYQQILSTAYRITSNWLSRETERDRGFIGTENHSAFVTDTKTKTHNPPTVEPNSKQTVGNRNPREFKRIFCFVCGVAGHLTKHCEFKKLGGEVAL